MPLGGWQQWGGGASLQQLQAKISRICPHYAFLTSCIYGVEVLQELQRQQQAIEAGALALPPRRTSGATSARPGPCSSSLRAATSSARPFSLLVLWNRELLYI